MHDLLDSEKERRVSRFSRWSFFHCLNSHLLCQTKHPNESQCYEFTHCPQILSKSHSLPLHFHPHLHLLSLSLNSPQIPS